MNWPSGGEWDKLRPYMEAYLRRKRMLAKLGQEVSPDNPVTVVREMKGDVTRIYHYLGPCDFCDNPTTLRIDISAGFVLPEEKDCTFLCKVCFLAVAGKEGKLRRKNDAQHWR